MCSVKTIVQFIQKAMSGEMSIICAKGRKYKHIFMHNVYENEFGIMHNYCNKFCGDCTTNECSKFFLKI